MNPIRRLFSCVVQSISGRTFKEVRIQTDIYILTRWTVLQKRVLGHHKIIGHRIIPPGAWGYPLDINIMEGLFGFNNSVCIRETNRRLLIKWGIAIRINSPGR